MREKQCKTCGSLQYDQQRMTYLYSHQGKYLIVPNTPVEICRDCGTAYYSAAILKEIERQFFEIMNNTATPDEYLQVPIKAFG